MRFKADKHCVAVLCLLVAACEQPSVPGIGDGLMAGPNGQYAREYWQRLVDSIAAPRRVRLVGLAASAESRLRAEGIASVISGSGWAASLLEEPGLVAAVGHVGSQATLAAAAVYARAGVPLVTPNATARALRRYDHWTFPLLPDDGVQGAELVDFAIDSIRARRIAVLYAGDAFGTGILQGVKDAAERGGIPVDDVEVPNVGCEHMRSGLAISAIARALLARSHPDVVILAVGPVAGVCAMQELLRVRPDLWILGADSMDDDSQLRAAFPPARRLRFRTVSGWRRVDDERTRAFGKDFEAHFGRPPLPLDALAHDSYALLATAIREVGPDRNAIRSWLASLGRTRPAWEGIAGPVEFGPVRLRRLVLRPVD